MHVMLNICCVYHMVWRKYIVIDIHEWIKISMTLIK